MLAVGPPTSGDIPLEIRQLGQRYGFSEDRFLAAPADGAAFVHCNRAEVAFAVTAAMGADGKADGLQRLYLTLFFIIGVLDALKRQRVNRVHFFLGGIWSGRILHQEAVAVLLNQSFGGERIVVW